MIPARRPILRRVWVVGPTGSGKSTLADLLAARAGLPVVHLDDWHWGPDWSARPEGEFVGRADAATRAPAWVVDGNYRRARQPFLSRADLVVWLDLPFAVTFPRILRRTTRRVWTGERCCNGNRESVRHTFVPRRSILWWAITTHDLHRRALSSEVVPLRHVRLRHPGAVRRFVRAFPAARPAP